MFTYDLNAELTSVALMNGANVSANGNGASVDIVDYKGKLVLALAVGEGTGTNPAITVNLQHSSDNSNWSFIGTNFTAVNTAAGASLQQVGLDCRAVNRYIRTNYTVSGTTPNVWPSVVAVGQKFASG
jgi:hypothetical protein